MTRASQLILIIITILLMAGCAKEVDRIPFNSLETIEQQFTLSKEGPIQLWTDLDIKYSGRMAFIYEIEILKNNEIVAQGQTDAMLVYTKLYSTEVTLGNKHHKKYQGKLSFNSGVLPAGDYLIRVTPKPQGSYSELIKYDIIIKQ